MNGSATLMTNRASPLAIRRRVFSANGRLRSNMEGHGIDQSITSAAVGHGSSFPAFTSALAGSPWVGLGHTMGAPSRRAIRNRRLRMVGVP
ncbi:hypothetical protein D3C75_1094250 [compost metagenome]